MVNEITTAIAQKLSSFDGEVYIDHLPQGFTEPCFFILLLTMNTKQIIGDRYLLTCNYNVRYYSKAVRPARELGSVADRLWLALEYVKLPSGDMRGAELSCRIHDGVLHFFVQYDMFVLKKRAQEPYMRTLEQQQKLKE